jgi:hypothetical protein
MAFPLFWLLSNNRHSGESLSSSSFQVPFIVIPPKAGIRLSFSVEKGK